MSPVKVIDVELARPLTTVTGLQAYREVEALVWLQGRPVGRARVPVRNGRCEAADLADAVSAKLARPVLRQHLIDWLLSDQRPAEGRLEDVLDAPPAHPDTPLPGVTVAVCTRDRVADLASCLEALSRVRYPKLELLVVDNAPSGDAAARLVTERFPDVRYVREPRPGLDWARNRAIAETATELIAFTDDDVIVDAGWVAALGRVFAEDPRVMAVTGLVVPDELDSDAQVLFERAGGFGRGFVRRWHRLGRPGVDDWHLGAGEFGTGANMAFRRELFDRVGRFDPALDVGTVTAGGGDLEMFFRVLQEGHTLVYEPHAVVRHRHRREHDALRRQLGNNGSGLYSYFVRAALAYPDQRRAVARFAGWWLWRGHVRRALGTLVRPWWLPRDLVLAELRGAVAGLVRYPRARREAERLRRAYGGAEARDPADGPRPPTVATRSGAVAVRMVDVGRGLRALDDVDDYPRVRVYVRRQGLPIGFVELANDHGPVSARRLAEAIVDRLGVRVLPAGVGDADGGHAWLQHALTQRLAASGSWADGRPPALAADQSASIVVATLDRPDDLRGCLEALRAQHSSRRVEIVVVDNNPGSGLTPPVVAGFPDVVLVDEPRRGLAYARNAGVLASRGDVVVMTDDDVRPPPEWLEALLSPFARHDVKAVTGNVLPLELETRAQQLFESYGGLGKGFTRIELDAHGFARSWAAVPTWRLGATANAAFRREVFDDPAVGLMEEALGPGMPSGVGEDTYLFYKVLKAGHTLVYEPSAYVWHRHRRELEALDSQLHSYSKGHVAYHLTTLLQDRDLRALGYLLGRFSAFQLRRLAKSALRRGDYPLQLMLLELRGNLAGPVCLWRSHRRVRREGRSAPPAIEAVPRTAPRGR